MIGSGHRCWKGVGRDVIADHGLLLLLEGTSIERIRFDVRSGRCCWKGRQLKGLEGTLDPNIVVGRDINWNGWIRRQLEGLDPIDPVVVVIVDCSDQCCC